MVAVANRVKFFLAGNLLELVNPWLPGHPHDRTAALAGDLPFHRALELCGGTGYEPAGLRSNIQAQICTRSIFRRR